MKYRDHRGTIDESMETVREVESAEDILVHLNKIWEPFRRHVEEIKAEYACMDERIGWDTWYVMVRMSGTDYFIVAGMTDGPFESLKT